MSSIPRTLSLTEAAQMLRTTPQAVSLAIRTKGLPAAKPGRAWVLVDVDVVNWLRTQYTTEKLPCDSTNEAKKAPGGWTSPPNQAELDAALAPQSVFPKSTR